MEKLSKQLVMFRREKIKLLRSIGFSLSQIAEQLGVSDRTIGYDIKAIKKEYSKQSHEIDLNIIIEDLKRESKSRKRELKKIIDDAKTDNQVRVNAIKAWQDENSKILGLLQSVGKIKKTPEEIKAKLVFKFEE